MTHELRWLVRQGIERGLFNSAQCMELLEDDVALHEDLVAFAQKLIDAGIVADQHLPTLEALLDQALGMAAPTALAAPTAATRLSANPFARGSANPFHRLEVPYGQLQTIPAETLAATMRDLLKTTSLFGASDLHLSAGTRPFIRKNRNILYLADHALSADDSLALNTALLTPLQRDQYLEKNDYDYALALDADHRYRVNLMRHKTGPSGSYRMVPGKIKTLDELGFRLHLATLQKLLSYHNGLILVTGPVGAGKTTTLASMVAYLNETRSDHIITVEDPIEVVQTPKGCNITQREVGLHTRTFASALKAALREDPDVIVIGELRDLETIEMAIPASETGHLVIRTMNTSGAATTLNRLLDAFPPSQQQQIRASVAESLRGVLCQRLLPSTQGGLVMATEILVNNLAISSLIREGKAAGLRNAMETGSRDGMCIMDNSIYTLFQQKLITAELARAQIQTRTLKSKITAAT